MAAVRHLGFDEVKSFETDCIHWFGRLTVGAWLVAEPGLDDDVVVEGVPPLQVLAGGCSVAGGT